MAKKARGGEPSKSKLILDYLKAHRNAKAKSVAEALNAEHGLNISPQYVSTIKSNAKRKRGGKGRRKAAAAAAGNGGLTLETLKAAKSFLSKFDNNPKQAKAAVDLFAQLLD